MDILTRVLIYDAMYAVGFALMVTLCVIRSRAYHISRLRAGIYCVFTFLSGYFGAWLIGKIFNLIAALKGWEPDIKVDVLGAVIFTSPLLLAYVYAEKGLLRLNRNAAKKKGKPTPDKTVSFRDTLDLMIQGALLVFASIKLGCLIRGCCYGVECEWGFDSPYIHKTVFPVQIFECLSLLLILIAVYTVQQTKYNRRGMGGPFAAFLYGAARFFWEFFRWYTPETRRFFLGLTLWQIFCVPVLIVAGIWLFVLFKTQPSEPMPKSRSLAAMERVLVARKKRKQKTNKNPSGNGKRKKHGKRKKRR